MAGQELLLSFLLVSLLAGHRAVNGLSQQHQHQQHVRLTSDCPEKPKPAFKPTKLFVFGDSYADTGNNKKWEARSWKVPYGMTFPGFPVGRFSDGLVFTDLLARFFQVKSPLPVQWWTRAFFWTHLTFGTNFAYGGTGVFDTFSADPNMTAQIDCFEDLVGHSFFKAAITGSSMAFFTNSGNDYDTYLAKNGDVEDLLGFIGNVTDQLAANMKRVSKLGVRKIAVAALQPLGCLPQFTAANSFKTCNDSINTLVQIHNEFLQDDVDRMNNETHSSTFAVIDLYSAFNSVILNSTTFKHPFKPCCMGVSSEYLCGNVDAKGRKKYTVCEDPSTHFFWDTVHPTQAGWNAVYSILGPNLGKL